MTKYVEILSAVDGFRRGGVAHPNVKTVHRVDAFSKVQLEQIKNEPRLSVRFFEVEEKKTEPEPAEKKQDENGCVLPRPENKAIEPEKYNKNKGLQENASLCSGWLCKLDNLRTRRDEIKDLQSRAEILLAFIKSAA